MGRCRSADQKVMLSKDHDGAIRLANNPRRSLRSNHIDVRYHLIRNEVKKGCVNVKVRRCEA